MSARRVLVTGGSRGIGLAVARALAEQGWRTVLVARSADRLEAAAAELSGGGHETLALDVSDDAAWGEAMNVVDRGGPVDGLVAAAGVLGPIGDPIDWPIEEFRRTLDVNVTGTLLALRHAAPRLAEAGGGAVTLSGGGATAPLPRFDAYAASKAAVVRLTENLAAAGIRVNAVAPGFIATEMHEATLEAGPEVVGPEYFERTRSQLAEGGADLDAVCELVAFLLSPEAAAIRGKLIAAQWDPWREDEFRRRLAAEPDLATLRRIDDFSFGKLEGG
jgi:NAD(P)-dependent dehydrogenase (short-subunit alcohol dehydrogenase family)